MRRWPLGVVAALQALVLAGAGILVASRATDHGSAEVAAVESRTAAARETLAAQIERVTRIVEEIRGLQFTSYPPPVLLSPEALAERVLEHLADYTQEEADADRRILAALGMIPSDLDLRAAMTEALGQQVAGFYDPETAELVVGRVDAGSDNRLGRIDELTLAHELQHALADQALGLPDLDLDDLDAVAARQALMEGDATVTMGEYLRQAFTIVDQLMIGREAARLTDTLVSLSDLPYVLQRSLMFPYEEGAAFVTALFSAGGWPAVDAAYQRPPRSTAEILFPQRYLEGQVPEAPPPLAAPGGGFDEVRRTTFGAVDLLLLFEAPGGRPGDALSSPRVAASAWQGGMLGLWTRQEETVVAFSIRTQTPQLCSDLQVWYPIAFPSVEIDQAEQAVIFEGAGKVAAMRCTDDGARFAVAPTRNLALRVVSR